MKKVFQVSDVCDLESLTGVTVLAGEKNLNHIVEHINVMEVPDIDNWVQPNEFLMTTGFMYKEDPSQFLSLIPRLKEQNVAALGIKTKRFIDEIPEELIRCATLHDFPLLLLPENTTFSLVIREGMERILLSEKERKAIFLKKLITGAYASEHELLNAIPRDNLNYSKSTLFTLFIIAEKEDHVMYEKEVLYHNLSSYFRGLGFECHHVIHHNHLVLILSSEDKALVNRLNKGDAQILQYLKNYEGILCEINRNISINAIREEYERLKKMQQVVELCNITSPWIAFSELGLYSAIPEISDSLFYYYSKSRYIEPLIRFDEEHNGQLYETLKVYFECNCNMKYTAEKMFTHYNTVCKRIEKIETILSIDLDDFHTKCTIYLSLLI